MNRTRTRRPLSQENETRILARIVETMLSVQDELEEADGAEWSQILVDACQRKKRSARQRRMQMAAAC
ncbi:MAG: hypothetical protein KJ000_27770 [Pirellulaceae bacterium]|nr:hypothetical protein [Pirellulaceae bacterium]